MLHHSVPLYIVLLLAMVLTVVLKKLTVPGAITGGFVGWCVFQGAGGTGIAMLGAFFILGTAATSHKRNWKAQSGISKKEESRRTAGQVVANGGCAAIVGLLVLCFPERVILLQTMMAASLASATADTLSSELGVVHGKRFYNIRSFKKDQCGLDGVVSWEGTAAGIAGSLIIAIIYSIGFGFSKNSIWIIIAGTIGNLADSYLGATLERAKILGNNAVNFLNTTIATLTAWLLFSHF